MNNPNYHPLAKNNPNYRLFFNNPNYSSSLLKTVPLSPSSNKMKGIFLFDEGELKIKVKKINHKIPAAAGHGGSEIVLSKFDE